mmetsp:Transcript_28651/g.66526  ORF Transcript_28651/g.66526 Transcript_28651/m.66526 type:complete len:682 (+) Transcript_28651:163-2208(+)
MKDTPQDQPTYHQTPSPAAFVPDTRPSLLYTLAYPFLALVYVVACIVSSLLFWPLVAVSLIVTTSVRVLTGWPNVMRPEDGQWFADSPGNPTIINAVMIFEKAVSKADLMAVLQERWLGGDTGEARFPRFTKSMSFNLTGPTWLDPKVGGFNLADHIHAVDDTALDVKSGVSESREALLESRESLQAAVGDIITKDLPSDKPRWCFTIMKPLVDPTAFAGDTTPRYPVVFRIHHCMADGMALMDCLMSTMAKEDGTDCLPRNVGMNLTPLQHVGALIRSFFEGPLAVLMLLLLPADRSPLHKATAPCIREFPSHVVAWSSPTPLAKVKELQKQLGCTLNDLLCGVLSLALARAMEGEGFSLDGPPKGCVGGSAVDAIQVRLLGLVWVYRAKVGVEIMAGLALRIRVTVRSWFDGENRERHISSNVSDLNIQDVRAAVPINMRPNDSAIIMQNDFGVIPVTLAVGDPSNGRNVTTPAADRVMAMKARFRALKSSIQPFALVTLATFTQRALPFGLQKVIVDLLADKLSLLLTNVPGPSEPVFLRPPMAGSSDRSGTEEAQADPNKLLLILPWVPARATIELGLSIFSYNSNVVVGVRTSSDHACQPRDIAKCFESCFDELVQECAAMLEGNGSAPTALPASSVPTPVSETDGDTASASASTDPAQVELTIRTVGGGDGDVGL